MPLPSQPPVGPAALSQNARTVLEKRYLVKDRSGKPTETPEDMFWRVSTVVAEADRRYGASEGAVTALAWVVGGKPTYAFEGIINYSAATIAWLKDQLGLIRDASEADERILDWIEAAPADSTRSKTASNSACLPE